MKPLSTKGAIGLSMNVLVIIIISIVILVGSVSFLYNLINKSEEFRQGLDQQTESQLKQLLIDQGKLTAVYPYKVTMSHGEEKVFGIGVLNVNIDSGASFSVNIDPTGYLSVAGQEAQTVNLNDLKMSAILYNHETFKVLQNEHKNVPVLISIPRDYPEGTYIFTANVLVDGQPYPPSQKFYVEAR
jgi:hypothetical protein